MTHNGRRGKPAVVVPASLVSGRTSHQISFQTFFSLGTSLPGFGIGGGGIYRSAVDVVASCRRTLGGDGGGGSRSTNE